MIFERTSYVPCMATIAPEHRAPPVPADLVEYYFEQAWSDGLPVVPPTPAKIDAVVEALGGDPSFAEAVIPPRRGTLTREVLAINMVMAGCKPEYAPVVRAAMLALCTKQWNLNGVQATTHMAAPLLIVNGPIRNTIGMNAGHNCFGSGNRANATIGRAIRLILLTVGGATPGDLDKSTLGHPGKYTYCIAENEELSPWAPYHVEHGYRAGGQRRLRHRGRTAAQRREPRRERRARRARQHRLRDEHVRAQQRRRERFVRGRDLSGARGDDRVVGILAPRRAELSLDERRQHVG